MPQFIKVNSKHLNIDHIIKVETRDEVVMLYLTGTHIETVSGDQSRGLIKALDQITIPIPRS